MESKGFPTGPVMGPFDSGGVGSMGLYLVYITNFNILGPDIVGPYYGAMAWIFE